VVYRRIAIAKEEIDWPPPKGTKRQILEGIFYRLKNGWNWRDLPKDFPPYSSTVFWHYKQWRSQGIIQKITEELHRKLRQQEKKLVDDSNYD
jgi:transposase